MNTLEEQRTCAEQDDAARVLAWGRGDAAAYETIYRKYYPMLLNYAKQRLGDPTEAHDVVHDSFIRASRQIGALRDPNSLGPWLYKIVRNRIHNQSRIRAVPHAEVEV